MHVPFGEMRIVKTERDSEFLEAANQTLEVALGNGVSYEITTKWRLPVYPSLS